MDIKSLHHVAYRTTPEMKKKLASVSEAMLQEWSKTKKAPHHADWVHKK